MSLFVKRHTYLVNRKQLVTSCALQGIRLSRPLSTLHEIRVTNDKIQGLSALTTLGVFFAPR